MGIRSDDYSNIIGVDIEVSVDFLEFGELEEINDTLEIRTMEIESPNAEFISLIFSEFRIPENDEMYIYNRKKTILMGPFTSKNNPYDSMYAIDIIEDDNLILEYHRKKYNDAKGKIFISKVIHGLNPLLRNDITSKERNTLQSNCYIDVNCPEGDGWDNQKNGTCFILWLGYHPSNPTVWRENPWASAALINNTRQDYTPYILTAEHNTQGSGNNISLWVFRFKYWRS